jgi:EmrB/QacA subfamily drug resistance transporter
MITAVRPPCDEGVIRSRPASAPCAPDVGRWVLVATILGSSMAFIDGSVVNVALPALQADLHATATDLQWIMEAYLFFLAALMLVGGTLGDHFGRRRVFAMGIALFTVASIWGGVAPNVGQLISARAVQGVGGALLVPGSLAIISASFRDEQRGQAIATWVGVTSITAAVGPLLGGWLVQYASWRLVFFINVPLAVVVLGVALGRVPESRDEDSQGGLDWWGALLTIIGLGAIVYGLIEADSLGVSDPLVLVALAIGIVALGAFLLLEARLQAPMVPLSLFRSPTFSGVNLQTLLLYAALGGITFFFPFDLMQVQGYSPTAAGAALVPFLLLVFLFSRLAEGLVDRYGPKLPLVVGPVITAVGFALFAVPTIGGIYWVTFFPAVLLMGVGMAINVAPMATVVMRAVEQRHADVASAVNNAVARAASLLAIAVLGIVIVSVFNSSLDSHLAHLQLSPSLRHLMDAQRGKLAGIQLPAGESAETRAALKQAVGESFVSGFRLVALLCAGLALASALCGWVMIKDKTAGHGVRAGKASKTDSPYAP